MGGNANQQPVDPMVLSAVQGGDPLQQLLSAHQRRQQPDALQALLSLLQAPPQPSSTLPHPAPTPSPMVDPYTRMLTSPEQFQSKMGETIAPAINTDLPAYLLGEGLYARGLGPLKNEIGAIGKAVGEGRTAKLPALIGADGKVYVGKAGDMHLNVATRHPEGEPFQHSGWINNKQYLEQPDSYRRWGSEELTQPAQETLAARTTGAAKPRTVIPEIDLGEPIKPPNISQEAWDRSMVSHKREVAEGRYRRLVQAEVAGEPQIIDVTASKPQAPLPAPQKQLPALKPAYPGEQVYANLDQVKKLLQPYGTDARISEMVGKLTALEGGEEEILSNVGQTLRTLRGRVSDADLAHVRTLLRRAEKSGGYGKPNVWHGRKPK